MDGPVSVDEALNKSIGTIGRWQFRISVLMSLLKFPIAWFQLGIVFLAPPTNFWCRRPPEYINTTVNEWLRMITPNYTESYNQTSRYGSCYMFDLSSANTVEQSKVPCLWGYEYDTSQFRSSIITEWNLVCGRERLVDLAQATVMFGILLGTIMLGIASDRIGRKPVLMICLAVQAFAGVLTAFAPTYWLLLLARFVTAFANAGTMVASFVICMEVVGGKWRTIIPILYQIPFGIGNSVMAGIAYWIRDWRELQLILSLLSALYLIYWRCVPESPRWLLATGRREAATEILLQAAAENKKPTNVVKSMMESLPSTTDDSTEQQKPNPSALFRTPTILTALCYMGILAVPVDVFVGDWPRIALAGLGVVGMSVSIPALYLFTGELFPTVLRNAGLGATVMCSRIGSMFAPFIISLSTVAPWLPLLVLGSLVFLEAILVLPLPETKDTSLPDTVGDAEAFIGKRIEDDRKNGNYVIVGINEQRH
ncbi:uncharacterized protein CBL_07602 [Carabus blaptoides fortunei]